MIFDLEDVIDATIVETLKDSIELQQSLLCDPNRFPIWFLNKEKDTNAVAHLIHCMKVVHDWYATPSDGFYFDYSIAKEEYENSSNS